MSRLNSLRVGVLILGILVGTSISAAEEPDIAEALRIILAVDKEGRGHADAVAAMQVLNSAAKKDIPTLLSASDQANPVAMNWIRGAIEKALRGPGELPKSEIRAYFDDRQRCSHGRLLAFDLLTRADERLAQEIIPQLIDDPSLPLRRLAIERLIKLAQEQSEPESLGTLAQAVSHARDVDQILAIRDSLAKSNVQIDLVRQLGFVPKWQIIAPFDHSNQSSFDVALGPETSIEQFDSAAEYPGKPTDGVIPMVKWVRVETSDPSGIVNLNEEIGKIKGAIAYAHTDFNCAESQPAQIRVGCINATKVWVNGELVISDEVYHNGMDPDQYIGNFTLKKGNNEFLIKVCQNEQSESWAQDWMFQVRVCDPSGKPILPTVAESSADQ